jgi:hypothetical protein
MIITDRVRRVKWKRMQISEKSVRESEKRDLENLKDLLKELG